MMTTFTTSDLEQLHAAVEDMRQGAALPMDIVDVVEKLQAEVERLRGLEEENAAIRELLSDAYDSWFYGEEASYSSPPWVDRAMALLGKEGTR